MPRGAFRVLQLLCGECDLTGRGCVALGLRVSVHVCACVCSWYVQPPGADRQRGEGERNKERKKTDRQSEKREDTSV